MLHHSKLALDSGSNYVIHKITHNYFYLSPLIRIADTNQCPILTPTYLIHIGVKYMRFVQQCSLLRFPFLSRPELFTEWNYSGRDATGISKSGLQWGRKPTLKFWKRQPDSQKGLAFRGLRFRGCAGLRNAEKAASAATQDFIKRLTFSRISKPSTSSKPKSTEREPLLWIWVAFFRISKWALPHWSPDLEFLLHPGPNNSIQWQFRTRQKRKRRREALLHKAHIFYSQYVLGMLESVLDIG